MLKASFKFAVLGLVVASGVEIDPTQSVSGIPWQCDCEADPEHCTNDHVDVDECTRLIEIAEAMGFKEDDPIGSPGNLLTMDPIKTHTIGCYNCWGQGVQSDYDTKISSIDWRGLGLMGTIPGQINQLTGLRNFGLSENNLSGPIPNLPGLESFDASRNMLTGRFPIGTWPSLWRLYVDHNQLTGSLPQGLDKSMPSLRRLGVSNNHFTGNIPSDIPFWNNSNVERRLSSIMCDFGGNQWSCPIEAWMRSGRGYVCEDVQCADGILI